MKYDFAPLRIDSRSLIFRGSLVRRFTAAIIDVIIPGGYLLFVSISNDHPTFGDAGNGLAGYINGVLFLIIFFLPELYFRKTLGMWTMNLVVIPSVKNDVWASLLVRKVMNLIEFSIPSPIYFWVTALSKDYSSLSDRVSGCIVVREAVLDQTTSQKKDLSKFGRVITALIFSCIPIILFITITLCIFMGLFGWETYKQGLI